MRQQIRSFVQSTTGYDIHKFEFGCDAYTDIRSLVQRETPVVFDVGANVGQTVDRMMAILPGASIHSFEPSPAAFGTLEKKHRDTAKVRLNNFALGASAEQRELFEHGATELSSFLEMGDTGLWSEAENRVMVPIQTLDDYCSRENITTIDILKSDTQGFDLEVLKGARVMLSSGNIKMLYLEISFAPLYKNMPRFDEVYRFIADQGFELVSFYEICHTANKRAAWADALFVMAPRTPARPASPDY